MKVIGVALTPPPAASGNPQATPELLASALAKFSRSNKGIIDILSTAQGQDPEKAIEAIFKFIDYGHASIGGLTGGIALCIEGVSLIMAYKLFDLAQQADGQESSTRYIELSPALLGSPEEFGVPESLCAEWQSVMSEAFSCYQQEFARLKEISEKTPEKCRIPSNVPPKMAERMIKNYALDRARYFLPVAVKNNVGLVMSARAWADVIKGLDSLGIPEATTCATLLRSELAKFAPRLIKHSQRDDASAAHGSAPLRYGSQILSATPAPTAPLADQVTCEVFDSLSTLVPTMDNNLSQAFTGKRTRYSAVGDSIDRAMVRVAWNNVAICELRDLIRHRTGARFSPLVAQGFYTAPETDRSQFTVLLSRYAALTQKLARQGEPGAHLYGYLLGTQVAFEHSTHLAKMIYEIELRTGLGAHFRYYEHLKLCAEKLFEQRPALREYVTLGTAEPE